MSEWKSRLEGKGVGNLKNKPGILYEAASAAHFCHRLELSCVHSRLAYEVLDRRNARCIGVQSRCANLPLLRSITLIQPSRQILSDPATMIREQRARETRIIVSSCLILADHTVVLQSSKFAYLSSANTRKTGSRLASHIWSLPSSPWLS